MAKGTKHKAKAGGQKRPLTPTRSRREREREAVAQRGSHVTPRVARRARALRPSDPVATVGGVHPLPEVVRLELIVLAMEELRAGSERGSTSQVWGRVSDSLIFEAASDIIIRQSPVEAIVKSLHDELIAAKVTGKSFARLLASVRNKAREKFYERIRDSAQADDFVKVKGDPKAMARLLNDAAAEFAYRALKNKKFASASVGKQHAVIRVCEAIRDTVKILADTDHKTAQTDKLREAVRKAEAELSRKAGRGGTRLGVDEAFKLVREHLGVGDEPPATGQTVRGVAA